MITFDYLLADLDSVTAQLTEAIDAKVILIFGDMGTGKTTLVKSICQRLGVQDEVSSPTFALVNEYLDKWGGSVYHFDMYRIEQEEEAMDFGIEEYFDSGQLCLVEWPNHIPSLWPETFGIIHIEHQVKGRRLQFFPNCTFETMPDNLKV